MVLTRPAGVGVVELGRLQADRTRIKGSDAVRYKACLFMMLLTVLIIEQSRKKTSTNSGGVKNAIRKG